MVKRIGVVILMLVLFLAGCKKSNERSCWKGHGDDTVKEIPITDSIASFILNKNVKYRIFQDNQNKIIVKGGSNMVDLVSADYDASTYEMNIANNNKCNFLRDSERGIEVEIHYPDYRDFLLIVSDSVIFEDTITSSELLIEMFESGGTAKLNIDANIFSIVVSRGTADYIVTGHANYAEIKAQDKGYANALGLTADVLFVYQNSTADIQLDVDSAEVEVRLEATGNVYYKGTPDQISESGYGSGKLIEL